MYYRDENGEWQEVLLEPSGDTLPIGSISAYAGENTPTNWLKCDGQAVSRTEYAELFSAIGTTYGNGDGTTTFNLPNINPENRTIIGASKGDYALGKTTGKKEHTLSVDELAPHTHPIRWDNEGGVGSGHGVLIKPGDSSASYSYGTSTTGKGTPFNIMQPSIALNYIIKVKQSVGLVGNISSDMNAQGDNDVAPAKVIKEYVDNKSTYSKEEKVVGTYLGKPLYRKVLTGNLPKGSGENVFDISDAVINKIEGMVKSQYGSWFELNCYYVKESGYSTETHIKSDRSGFYLTCGGFYNTSSLYEITIEYTKTID